MFNVGSVVATFKADLSDFSAGVSKAKKDVSSLSNTFGGLGGIGDDIFNVAKKAAIALGAAATAATVFSFKSAAAFEQDRIAFDVMLGSADKARVMMQNLSDFARRTPFTLPQVVDSARQLMALGVASQDVMADLKMVGDVSAGVGMEKLPLITHAFGEVATAGRLTGIQIREFTNNGVPIVSELAKAFGKTTEEITKMVSNGEISFPMVVKAFQGMTSSGGKFNDMMNRQSKTFAGTMSNLSDDLGRVARNIVGISDTGDVIKGSLFDKVSNAAMNLLTWIDANKDAIVAFAQNAIKTAIEWGGKLVTSIKEVIEWFKKHRTEAIAIAVAIGVFVAAAMIASAVIALAALGWGVAIAAAAAVIGFAVTEIVGHWDLIKRKAQEIWDAIKTAFKNGVDSAVRFFKNLPDEILFALGYLVGRFIRFNTVDLPNFIFDFIKWFMSLPSKVGSAIQSLWNFAVAGFNYFRDHAKGWASDVINDILQFFKDLPGRILSTLTNGIGSIGGGLKRIGNDLLNGFKAGLGLPHAALGVTNFGGGLIRVGENGPETVVLPRGSSVLPSTKSNAVGGTVINNVSLNTESAAYMFFKKMRDMEREANLGVSHG